MPHMLGVMQGAIKPLYFGPGFYIWARVTNVIFAPITRTFGKILWNIMYLHIVLGFIVHILTNVIIESLPRSHVFALSLTICSASGKVRRWLHL